MDRHATAPRQTRIGTRIRLAVLAVLGIATVSIPVTIAVVLSATGASDRIVMGNVAGPQVPHASPAAAVSALRCEPDRGYYALTFDDGPVPRTTPRLVATLRSSRAVATFFVLGRRAEATPALVELQRSVGQVANHGYSHARLTGLSTAARLDELRRTARVLDYPNALFRPPYGETDAATDADIRRTGLEPVYWTVHTGNRRPTADVITARALTVRPGGIIVLDERLNATIDAVPRIVSALRRRGMCPGFLDRTRATVTAPGGRTFHVRAVRP